MQDKTKERIDFIKRNPYMSRTKIAKELKIEAGYLTRFAEQHNLTLKTGRELLEDFIKENPTLSAQELCDAYSQQRGEHYNVNYICTLARELYIELPHSRSKKIKEGKFEPNKPSKKVVRVEEEKILVRPAPIRSPDYDKPRSERCPAVYSQSSSPYGYAEKLGVTVKTIKR